MDKNIIWYDEPAREWIEGFPLGNGRTAAMLMGWPQKEYLYLNHEHLWRRNVTRYTVPVHQHLEEIRELCLRGAWKEAQRVIESKLQPVWTGDSQKRLEEYQPFCNLSAEFVHNAPSAGYKRSLDLGRALSLVEYEAENVRYSRTCFVSCVRDIICQRVICGGGMRAVFQLVRPRQPECTVHVRASGDMLTLQGAFDEGVRFACVTKILSAGSYAHVDSYPEPVSGDARPAILVSDADAIECYTVLCTDHLACDPLRHCLDRLAGIGGASYDELEKEHIRGHKKLYDRVTLQLGAGAWKEEADNPPTHLFLRNILLGASDNRLYEQMLNFSRYLLISSSRSPGTCPANLQGKWNKEFHAPWGSDYHINANFQMNYWQAEACNLSECTLPVFDLLDACVPEGEKNARDLYNCRGMVLPHFFSLTKAMMPGPWVALVSCAAWMAAHYWWHYEYTLDTDFLRRRAYPYMRKCADFLTDYLVRDRNGRYAVVPSISSENTPLGRDTMICKNPTMDIAVIRELLRNLTAAAGILGVDVEMIPVWEDIIRGLPDWPVNSDGSLAEWADDDARDNHQHRHLSQLYPLFPSDLFTQEETPLLVQSARKALYARKAEGRRNNAGWSYPWYALLHARLGEGNAALESLTDLARGCMIDNYLTVHNDWRFTGYGVYWLFNNDPKWFQADAALGMAAAVAEMLLQSHGGVLRILPALPDAWPDGCVKGLRARGNFEVDIYWRNGSIRKVELRSDSGASCKVRLCRGHSIASVTRNGKKTDCAHEGEYILLKTRKGSVYIFE